MSNKNKQVLVSSIALVALVAITVGVSYAFFSYSKLGSKVNTVTTGVLEFNYTESPAQGNGIVLANAMPMPDNEGIKLAGSPRVFDFTVSSTLAGANINYSIAAIKQVSDKPLPDEVVKIYLTELSGNIEIPAPSTINGGVVKRYSELGAHSSGGRTIYTGSFGPGSTSKTYRLRMWLASDATAVSNGSWSYNGQSFQVKVGVYGVKAL